VERGREMRKRGSLATIIAVSEVATMACDEPNEPSNDPLTGTTVTEQTGPGVGISVPTP
jgi:hypothetical protein